MHSIMQMRDIWWTMQECAILTNGWYVDQTTWFSYVLWCEMLIETLHNITTLAQSAYAFFSLQNSWLANNFYQCNQEKIIFVQVGHISSLNSQKYLYAFGVILRKTKLKFDEQ